MNAEQKQRAIAVITKWWAADSNKDVLSTGYEMAGVLQELIDAPEPEQPNQSEHHLEMVNAPAPSVPDGRKMVPDEPTAEMREAGHLAAWRRIPSLFDEDDAANVYRAMIKAAPKPPVLSDERIFKLFLEKAVDKGTAGIYDFARAIEREILGGGE